MILDDTTEEFFAYQQASFESPDLRPILLPMSGYEKSSAFEGMINLQAAAAAFPDSNAFGQYLQPVYPTEVASQHVLASQDDQVKQDFYPNGDFNYSVEFVDQREMMPMYTTGHSASQSMPEVYNESRKRKSSYTPEYIEPQPRKRAVVAHLQLQDINGDYHDMSSQPSPYSSVVPTPGNSISNQGGQEAHSPRFRHAYSTSNASQASLPAPSPHTPCWSPSFTYAKSEQSPHAPMTPAPRPASTSSAYSSHPKLVRTSTIPQQGSPSLAAPLSMGFHAQAFNPYAMYPHNKAALRLKGDLDAVAMDWSAEELEARRKLIVFSRSQTGSTIDAEFKTVAPQDWQRSDITINCIWWKERKEAFVTSVDTIALLEQLVAVRFTVEEKNRIRRNLEGFRPLTVSKAKPDSEDFFKVIMGFANPKPRNIEKDVKVFPWKILSHALKKIIGKYSASYSSTASTIVTPSVHGYASSEPTGDYQYMPSPNPEMVPNGLQPSAMPVLCYETGMPAERVAVPMSASMPGLAVHIPTMGPSYNMVPFGYGYDGMQSMHHPQAMMSQPGSAPIQSMQTAWNAEGYGVQQMGPASAPPTAFPRDHIETAALVTPAYHMRHQ